MRLCGISSRFQLLSPSTRQVTHALLTRPPLTYISLGFNVSPFDLHVLGTPPAFILSQDQTLMLKVFSCQFYLALFTVNSGSFSIFRSICLFLNFSENLGIFRVALLFICQRSVFLSLLLFSAATLISYHDRFRLSTTFSIFLNLFPTGKLSFSRWIFILPHCPVLCQQLFTFIFQSIYNGGKGVKKEISIT